MFKNKTVLLVTLLILATAVIFLSNADFENFQQHDLMHQAGIQGTNILTLFLETVAKVGEFFNKVFNLVSRTGELVEWFRNIFIKGWENVVNIIRKIPFI